MREISENVFTKPSVNFPIFPPGAMAKDLDAGKMEEFIHGHLFFAKFVKVEDVELADREAFTEYKVKRRLRDLQRSDVQNHYKRMAVERATIDYSLLSPESKIYPKILQFDREWKTVLMKNLQKLPCKYSVSRTFGIGPEDYRKRY